MMTGYVIYNPYEGKGGVHYYTFSLTREGSIACWEARNGETWKDTFPNLKCSLFKLTEINL